MARKIFVSYKHDDDSVYPGRITARVYVNALMDLFENEEIYKGERDEEDLSEFKNEAIRSHLRNKIYDSSITLVLISPNMKDPGLESDQWIPWEISYSLKEIPRQGRRSLTNAMLAVVLPDRTSSYSYFFQEDTCHLCHCTTLCTNQLFQILCKNMFNIKIPVYNGCQNHFSNNPVFTGQHSYIASVKWCDFIADKEKFLQMAEERRDRIDDYEITKPVPV